MFLHALLTARAAEGRPLRVGLIGAGRLGTLALAQARRTPGLHVMAVADLTVARARAACAAAGWEEGRAEAGSPAKALRHGTTWATDDAEALVAAGGLEVVIEATGDAEAALRHAAACLEHGRPLVMATAEADALVGPLLARRFAAAGLVYGLAYGSRPALVCELVDRARTCGLEVLAAGVATPPQPDEPPAEDDRRAVAEADGTAVALALAAVANATGLAVPADLPAAPLAEPDTLAVLMQPRSGGGLLPRAGVVAAVTTADAGFARGGWVTVAAGGEATAAALTAAGVPTDAARRTAALWRPQGLGGLEVGVSVAAACLRGVATGHPAAFLGDVVAVAKRDLVVGEVLDGPGGSTVRGALMPAEDAVAAGLLPLALADRVTLLRPVAAGRPVPRAAVRLDPAGLGLRLRHELEAAFCAAPPEDEGATGTSG